jgi:hypothetical protein
MDSAAERQERLKPSSGGFLFVGLPDKTHCTVYYTVPFLRCKLLKYILISAATNSSKAEEARSNRAGQAKFHFGSYRPVDCGLLTQSYVSLARVGLTLDLAMRIQLTVGDSDELLTLGW